VGELPEMLKDDTKRVERKRGKTVGGKAIVADWRGKVKEEACKKARVMRMASGQNRGGEP